MEELTREWGLDYSPRVQPQRVELRRDLGVTDLTLTQVLFIVGLPWVGVAAKQGPAHVLFWLGAILLFYLPSAAVVIHLNRAMPLEGGLYQWAKLGFNDLTGFLVAWNLWLFAILNTSEIGLQITQYFHYISGERGAALAANKLVVCGVNVVIIAGLMLITIRGLSVGKWVHKSGGGFEYVAIHAGECRNPERAIARSVWIAAPIIGVMFILGTSSVLALVPMEQIDLIAPIPQVLKSGFVRLGYAGAIAPITILALLCIRVGQSSVLFAGNTRLPMVAGWDGLLPPWFTRLHPRYQTPVTSILFVGIITLAFSVAGLIGVGKQEAFQLLWNASAIFYALTYLVMFAIPIFALRSPAWLKVASASGFLMTLAFVILSILPIVQVESRLSFALKISSVVVVTNAAGLAIFLSRRARRSLPQLETRGASR